MNIFYLDKDPQKAARLQINKHVVKMILESAQMLCTAHRELGDENEALYKRTHKNHPSCVWVRESTKHYDWLYQHMLELGKEYTRRYSKKHLTITKMEKLLKNPPKGLEDKGFSNPPQCMPDDYKTECTVEAYQAYYEFKRETIEGKKNG